MAWLDREQIPLWQATGNHTTYDEMSETVFREILELPRNGPAGQEGLSYWVRHGDLLIVVVDTMGAGLGGEGYVETAWLRQVLRDNDEAPQKIVVGHHPVFPVNGFSGPVQREISSEITKELWNVLVDNDVSAYLCGHILAFDVQVHQGVLQICSAGAGTDHLMPAEFEFFHCLQIAVDARGLRYQVLDTNGQVREKLDWPVRLPSFDDWRVLPMGEFAAPTVLKPENREVLLLRFTGTSSAAECQALQTLFCCRPPAALPPLWIGLKGAEQRLTVTISPEPGRSPHYWLGPPIASGEPFDFTLMLHHNMGPGGIVCKLGEEDKWTSLSAASPWGLERLMISDQWLTGHGPSRPDEQPFLGKNLSVQAAIVRQDID